jgi:hypothetical protein
VEDLFSPRAFDKKNNIFKDHQNSLQFPQANSYRDYLNWLGKIDKAENPSWVLLSPDADLLIIEQKE